MSYPLILWDDGTAREVALPGEDQRLDAVNPAGVAVGSSSSDERRIPYVYRNGDVSPLPGVSAGTARAINEAGRIVGARHDAAGSKPVLWPAPDQPARDLPLPGRMWEGDARGIDAEGNVVGAISAGPRGPVLGYLWPADGGPARQLPLPTVPGGRATELHPVSIRSGWVTAIAYRDQGSIRSVHPVRYRLSTGEYVPLPLPIERGFVSAGNGWGWVAGPARPGAAVLITDAGVVPLPGLAGGTGDHSIGVRSLSDDGRVVGGHVDKARGDDAGEMPQPQAVRWRCR